MTSSMPTPGRPVPWTGQPARGAATPPPSPPGSVRPRPELVLLAAMALRPGPPPEPARTLPVPTPLQGPAHGTLPPAWAPRTTAAHRPQNRPEWTVHAWPIALAPERGLCLPLLATARIPPACLSKGWLPHAPSTPAFPGRPGLPRQLSAARRAPVAPLRIPGYSGPLSVGHSQHHKPAQPCPVPGGWWRVTGCGMVLPGPAEALGPPSPLLCGGAPPPWGLPQPPCLLGVPRRQPAQAVLRWPQGVRRMCPPRPL